jgi:hypothetical protein
MPTLPDDIKNCAESVTGWLKNAAPVKEGDWFINLDRGVAAFNRLNGNDNLKPCVFVIPISDASEQWNNLSLTEENRNRLPLVTQLARDPKVAGHFRQLEANSDVLWGYSPSDITADGITNSKSAFLKFSAAEALTDAIRNQLDLLYFQEGLSIFRVPVPFLGSPLLSCYLESNLTEATFAALDQGTKGSLITKLRSQVSATVVEPNEEVRMFGRAVGKVEKWTWFVDGKSVADTQDAATKLVEIGEHTIKVVVADATQAQAGTAKTVLVRLGEFAVEFKAPTQAVEGLPVQFAIESVGKIDSNQWSFGDKTG